MTSKTKAFLTHYIKNAKNYDKSFRKINFLSLGDGNCTAELTVEEEHVNSLGTLHGGCSSALIDLVSLTGLSTHKKAEGIIGATLNMHITFIKPAKLGDEVLISSKLVKAGRSLGFCDVEILNKKTNEILIKASDSVYIPEQKK